ncbi:hypothetical protein HYC85_012030 [Camellia sinensis]|uniref:Hyaluronan/mRNA-binding protein domain-containing protein n=1 Tax=Camellia sinensis TaxID=4442 RepID=A0A7J7HBY4_CAMSI|nr:hypothetical protein HYC85_012030 [Camellia sinensis]
MKLLVEGAVVVVVDLAVDVVEVDLIEIQQIPKTTFSSRGRGFNRDSTNNENSFNSNNGLSGGYKPAEDGDAEKPSERRGYGGPRGGFRGGRRGGFSNGEDAEGERPRRTYERRSGTGRGNEFKRDGAGRGNWGTPTEETAPETEEPANENEKNVDAEKHSGQEEAGDANKENPVNEPQEKEPEDKLSPPVAALRSRSMPSEVDSRPLIQSSQSLFQLIQSSSTFDLVVFEGSIITTAGELDADVVYRIKAEWLKWRSVSEEMTLEEYQKVLEEKRKALQPLKTEERKVGLDKDLASMQLLSSKKSDEEIFVKLGSDKDKRKEAAEKEERAKKSVSINDFLKPAEGGRYYSPGGRGGGGRGRRGGQGGSREGFGGGYMANNVAAPAIDDVGQFPTLGAK